MDWTPTNEEAILASMCVKMSEAIKLTKHNKDGFIFALLCTLKEDMPDEFEAALITFLKYGTGKDKV